MHNVGKLREVTLCNLKLWSPGLSLAAPAFASLKELGEISTKTFEKMGEQQLGLVSTYVDTGIKQVTLMTESKGYKDLMAGQTKLMTEYNEKVLDAMHKTTEIMTDSKDEMAAWFEKTQRRERDRAGKESRARGKEIIRLALPDHPSSKDPIHPEVDQVFRE